nr:TIGR01777 family oxidoreductase [uncultured Holophaga sp.]
MASRILISGGTGLVGRALCARLIADGHELTLLTRNTPPPAQPRMSFRPWLALEQLIPEHDAVINLAGEPIAQGRWTPERKRLLLESRTQPTHRIAQALARSGGPRTLVNASATGFYGYLNPEFVREDDPSGPGFLAGVCRAWEAEADSAGSPGVRVVKLRLGMVLAREGGALPRLARSVRWGLGTRLGDGKQGMSWIHLEDLVRLMARVVSDPGMEDIYNAVAPAPLSNADFTRTLAGVLRRPVLPVPGVLSASLLRLALGQLAEEMLLGGVWAIPARLQAQGFTFRFPDLESALQDLLGHPATP